MTERTAINSGRIAAPHAVEAGRKLYTMVYGQHNPARPPTLSENDTNTCYLMRNSSLSRPLSQRGARPRPVQVAPESGSRYFA